MKTYNHSNFFKHTFCEFQWVADFNFPEEKVYKSKSNSHYYYTHEGVYRKSNHWGRVANCRWKLKSNQKIKNQTTVIGFAKWTDFQPINSAEKLFYIEVDFEKKRVDYRVVTEPSDQFLFSYADVLKRIKDINKIISSKSWVDYLPSDSEDIKRTIILDLAHSSEPISSIKSRYS